MRIDRFGSNTVRGQTDKAIVEFGGSMDQSACVHMTRRLDIGIFFTLLALIALTAIPYGTVHPWWEALFECIVFALTALWIVEGLQTGAWRVREHSLLVPLIVLTVFAFAQSLPLWGLHGGMWRAISADPYSTLRVTMKLAALTLTGALLLRYISSPLRLRVLVYVVIGIGIVSALFGIVRQTTQGYAPAFILPRLSPHQGYGLFINKNHFALLMEMALGLLLGLIVGGGVRRDRLLICLAAALPLWGALVLSNSRGGLLGMLCQLLFLAFMFSLVRTEIGTQWSHSGAGGWLQRSSKSWAMRAALILCLVMAIGVGTRWLGGDPLETRLQSVAKDLRTGGRLNVSRFDIWRATWPLIKDEPLMGVGFGAYYAPITKYHDGSGEMRPWPAHNDYLELLASGGVIGLALAVWFVVIFAGQARERLRSIDSFRRAACLGALTGLLGVAVHSLVDFGLHITVNTLVFICLIVIATLNGRVEQEADPFSTEAGLVKHKPHAFDAHYRERFTKRRGSAG